jgi:hypothetical protein
MKQGILLTILGTVLALSACNSEHSQDRVSGEMMAIRAAEPAPMVAKQAPATIQRMLAYRYQFQFSIPAKNLKAVSQKALDACGSAGPNHCQIVSSSLQQYSDDEVSAHISLRVEPKWFESYRQSLNQDSREAGGKLVNSNVSAEDLTLAISDSDAKLNALKTLRTRLTALLETQGSTVKDLMEVERELARVQGQIEAGTARLRVLRTRVSMSEVILSYETKSVPASRSAFRPVVQALTDFVGTVSEGLAGLIYFIALILPWMIVGIPAIWLLRKWWRGRKPRKTKASQGS